MSKTITITFTANKKDLADFIKKQMIRDGYPETDLDNFENMMDEQDINQRLLHDLAEDIEIE